jgi:acyl-CoA-binding protein
MTESKHGYTVDENGVIRDLGKFEAEMYYAPYYWQQGLEGSFDEDENGVYFFLLGDTDYDAFPELKGEYGLAIEENAQGFVSVTVFSDKVGYNRSLARMVRDGAEGENA